MPTVQRYNDGQVGLNQLPGPRLNPNAADKESFGGGQSLENFSTASRNALFESEKIAIQHKIAADETAVQDADIQAGLLENKLRVESSKMRGKDAIGAKDFADSEWQKEVDKISSSLGNDRQRGLFMKKASARYVSLDSSVQAHTANETTRYQLETADAHMNAELTTVMQNSNNPDLVTRSMRIREADFHRKADLLGYDNEQRNAGIAEVRSQTHAAAIEGMITNADFELAKKYYEAHKGDLSAEDSMKRYGDYISARERQHTDLVRAEQGRRYDENNHKLLLDEVDGNLTYSEVVRRWKAGEISDSDFKSAQARLLDPSKAYTQKAFADVASPSPETFNEIRNAQISNRGTPSQIARMASKARDEGKLSDPDYQYLIKAKNGKPDNPKDIRINSQASFVRDFAERYYSETMLQKIFDKNKKSEDVESLVQEFYKRVDATNADGDQIDRIAERVIRDHANKRYPEISKFEDMPQTIVTMDGKIQKMLNPSKKTSLKATYKLTKLPPAYEKKKESK